MAAILGAMQAMEGGVPQAGSCAEEHVWMPVKHAARAAGVPERSAFRWAKKGVVPVRRSGKVQLVEVSALRAYAVRPVSARVAGAVGSEGPVATMAVFGSGSPLITRSEATSATGQPLDGDAQEVEERLCLLEVAWEEMEQRLAALEREPGAW